MVQQIRSLCILVGVLGVSAASTGGAGGRSAAKHGPGGLVYPLYDNYYRCSSTHTHTLLNFLSLPPDFIIIDS